MIYFAKYIEFEKLVSFSDLNDYIESINRSGYDVLYIKHDAFSDKEKEDFFHKMSEITNLLEIRAFGEFPITHFEDMKKLHYCNVKKIIFTDKTSVNEDVIKEGATRFGKDLVVDLKDFEKESLRVNAFSDFLNVSAKPSGDLYLIDVSEDIENVVPFKNELNEKGFETKTVKPLLSWADLKKNSDGLVPVIVTDYKTDNVLMMAYMNEEAYVNTFKTGLMNYYSRSRQSQWIKGETSGHFQYLKYMKADCDKDTLMAGVSQIGAACHTGSYSCFFNDIYSSDYSVKDPGKILDNLYNVITDRKANPKEGSYTNYLFDKGLDKILKKVGEEACEIVIASKNEEPQEIKYEIADFLYHLSVLMVEKGVTWNEVFEELANR